MSGISRVLKSDLKEYGENLTGAIIGLLIGVGFLSIFLAKTVMAEKGISFQEFLSTVLVLMMLLVMCITLALSQAQSLSFTYPTASKLGNKRSDIAFGLIIKDIIILILAVIIMYLLSHLLLSNVQIEILDAFGKTMSPSFLAYFVIGVSSISLLGGLISYIFRVDPIIGAVLGIIFGFILFLNGNIMDIYYISNPYLLISLFLIGQALRFVIISKLDTRI